MKCKKKIGLITWHYYPNFGSALQAYALQKYLLNEGYNVKIIDYRNPVFGKTNRFYDYLRCLRSYIIGRLNKKYYRPFIEFQFRYQKTTKRYFSKSEIQDDFDVYICGSDQIWAPNVFNPVYMLDFVRNNNARKVSYAASIGLNYISTQTLVEFEKLLSDFYKISVRESSSIKLLPMNLDKEKICSVLDPTFLLEKEDYIRIEKRIDIKEKFVFCYFLNEQNNYKDKVVDLANKNNLKIYGCSSKNADANWIGNFGRIGPREFIWMIHHASIVVTDSYHATIFSLLFHKSFITFKRFDKNDSLNQNSRIIHLCEWFKINNMIVDSNTNEPLSIKSFDYFEFDSALNEKRIVSKLFLKEAIE